MKSQRQLHLRSGGIVIVTLDDEVDILKASGTDRMFLNSLAAKMDEYEKAFKAKPEGDGDD